MKRILSFLLIFSISDIISAQSRDSTLIIGKVDTDLKLAYSSLKPLGDYVVSNMSDVGIKYLKVVIARSNEDMIKMLQKGDVDWINESAFSSIEFSTKAGAEIILRTWKKGVPEYNSVIFVHKDSGIYQLSDLKGKKIAFEDRGSTSSFFLPASVLLQNNLDLIEIMSPRENVPAGQVGYFFTGSEMNLVNLVYRQIMDAAAFSNLDWHDALSTIPDLNKDLVILHHTKPIPQTLELVRKDLPEKIKERLISILTNAHKDQNSENALQAYYKSTKFESVSPQIRDQINTLRKLKPLIEPYR